MAGFSSVESHVAARRITVGAGLACAAVAWIIAGAGGLTAGATATALVVAFFWTGAIPLRVAEGAGRAAGLAVLLLTYTLRLALALLVLRLTYGVVDRAWLGATIIVCALTWLFAHVVAFVRAGRSRPGGGAGPAANSPAAAK